MNPNNMDSGTKLSNGFNENAEWLKFYGDMK